MALRVAALQWDDIPALWECCQHTPQIFHNEVVDERTFAESITAEGVKHWVLWDDDTIVGLFTATNIRPGHECVVHNTWFDKQLDLERAIVWAQWGLGIMAGFDLKVCRGMTPAHRVRSIEWMKNMGLHEDGRLRYGHQRPTGEWVDIVVTSITPEEAEAALERAKQMLAAMTPEVIPEVTPQPAEAIRKRPKRAKRSPRFTLPILTGKRRRK